MKAPHSSPASLRWRLLRWIVLPLLVFVAIDTYTFSQLALQSADTAYDRSLLASARAISEHVHWQNGKISADVPYSTLDIFDNDLTGQTYYRVGLENSPANSLSNQFITGYADLPPLPSHSTRSRNYPALIHFYTTEYRGQTVRVGALYHPMVAGTQQAVVLIQVAETLDTRAKLAREIWGNVLVRQCVLVLFAALLLWWGIGRGLQPLLTLQAALAARTPDNLDPLPPLSAPREVHTLWHTLNDYVQRLASLVEVRRRFIANASHQLKTPLAIIKTQADLAARSHDPTELRTLQQGMGRAAEHAARLANQLLTLAHAESGLNPTQKQACDLRAIAQEICLELAPKAIEKQISLDFICPAENLPPIPGDPGLLYELMANLLSNAIQYTPANGQIAVSLSSEALGDQAIDPEMSRIPLSNQVLIQVCDSGPGIPSEKHAQALARFGTIGHPNSGSGLGLTIVQEIAHAHHAQLTLRQHQPHGLCAEVVFTLDQTSS